MRFEGAEVQFESVVLFAQGEVYVSVLSRELKEQIVSAWMKLTIEVPGNLPVVDHDRGFQRAIVDICLRNRQPLKQAVVFIADVEVPQLHIVRNLIQHLMEHPV